jgi:hypothetical protein
MEVGFISVKDQWTQTLADGTEVTYTYETILSGLGSAKARTRGSNVLHLRNNIRDTMGHREVEALFKSELIKIASEQHENGSFAALFAPSTANLFETSDITSGR